MGRMIAEQEHQEHQEHIEARGLEPELDPLYQVRLDFAENCFNNVQELNRSMDQKASFLLASVGLLTGSIGLLAFSALNGKPDLAWPGILRSIGVLLILSYLLVAFNVTHYATKVYRAAPNGLRPDTAAPGLIFPLMLLSRYHKDGAADEDLYLARLESATPKELLHDYVNQIMEVSNIYRAKQKQVNMSLRRFEWLSVLWVATMLVLVASAVLAA